MGFFTWTFADQKIRRKLPYDGRGYILCPDGTLIEERCYEGYGIFDGHDVYELVVDWNKDHLLQILEKQGHNHGFYYEIARIYMEQGTEAAQQYADECVKNKTEPAYIRKDWKRSLGIKIGCTNNPNIPFPIKIVSTSQLQVSYNELPASVICQ